MTISTAPTGRRAGWIVNLVLVLALVAGIFATFLVLADRSGAPPDVRTVPVARGPVAETVTTAGQVASATTSTVNFTTPGEVTGIAVTVGQQVTRGQELASIDDTVTRAQLRSARAGLESASDQLDEAEDNPASTDAQLAQLRAAVAQNEAAAAEASRAQQATTLTAPQDGVVASIDGQVGQQVSGGGSVTSTGAGAAAPGDEAAGGELGPPEAPAGGAGAVPSAGSGFITLVDLGSLQVSAEVPELDIARVRVGQLATVLVNALPGRTLTGRVTAIDLLPGSGSAVSYATTVTLDEVPPELRPGQSAGVEITVAAAPDAIFLPSVAVRPLGGASSGKATVTVLAGGAQQQRTVTLGVVGDTVTEVVSGLAVGELAVLPEPAVGELTPPEEDGDSVGNGSGE